jgi:6-phosphogluconolactonase
MARALAADLAARLNADCASRGRASLVVSGGRTPVRFFRQLSRAAVDWRNVSITLADERLVPADHERSNARLVREHLLRNNAKAARFAPLWGGSGAPLAVAQAVLRRLPRPFTAVVLGMGEDGHTASLFPMMSGLAGALDPKGADEVIEVPAVAGREARISLTLRALCDSAGIVLAFEGSAKRRTFERALGEGPPEELPVRAILRQTLAAVDVWSTP